MKRSRERVRRHWEGAGPERDDAQPDADRKWSIENEPEEEKEKAQLQARLKREADEPPESSTYPRHNSVRSDHHESYVEDRKPLKPRKPGETGFEWLEGYKNLLEQESDNDAVSTDSSTSDTDKAENHRTIDPSSVSHLIPDQIGNMILDRTRNVWFKREIQHDQEDDPFADIPDLPVDGIQELQMRGLRPGKTQDPKLAGWEDKSLTNSSQRLRSGKYGSTEDVEQARLKELYHKSDLKKDMARSQPGDHADWRHEDFDEVGGMTFDWSSLRPTTPITTPIDPEASPPHSYHSIDFGDPWGDDQDNVNHDDKVVVVEENTQPASLYAEFDGGAEFSMGNTDSHASYSAIFSEESREQPTDPSSWLDSLSMDWDDMRGHPVSTTPSGTNEKLYVEREVEECSRSISSVADSIGSAVSDGGSLGQAGVNYVVAKFTQSDPELLALYSEASQRLTKGRFVDNNRRLLKMFYLDFAREKQTSSQRQAVAFFRSRRRRAEISLDIFRTVTPDHDANYSVEGQKKDLSMLNAYFETLNAADEHKSFPDVQDALESEESEGENDEEQPSLDMTSLQAIGEYFVTSRAFSQYKQRLHQCLHPVHEKEHHPPKLRGAQCDQEPHRTDVSRELEPEANNLVETGIEHSLGNQKEGRRAQRPGKTQNNSIFVDSSQPLASLSHIEGRRMPWERDSFATWVTKWATDTLWPPSNGSKRMWYFCGCGQYTYIDVKELEPGGMESEWRTISESSAAVTRTHSPQGGASSVSQLPATPSPVHLGPTSSRNTVFPSSPSESTSHAPQPYIAPGISPGQPRTTRDPMFLLICINGKAYKTLAELRCLDIDDSYNDELLIRGILNQYEQARNGCQWTIDLLIPKWMLPAGLLKHFKTMWEALPVPVRRPSFVRDSLLGQSMSEWWSRWALDISPWAPLHVVDTADFVEFELVPHPEGKEAFPSHFTSGRWPAPDNKQYRYRPVPMKCVKTMNLWHMRRPGPHTEVYWYNTVPKKVDGALYRPSGTIEDVVGYGVRINERLNDVLVLWWSFIFTLVTGVIVYVYSRCTSDDSSAFGLGAYLVAVFTVYIQLQYAWWKRT